MGFLHSSFILTLIFERKSCLLLRFTTALPHMWRKTPSRVKQRLFKTLHGMSIMFKDPQQCRPITTLTLYTGILEIPSSKIIHLLRGPPRTLSWPSLISRPPTVQIRPEAIQPKHNRSIWSCFLGRMCHSANFKASDIFFSNVCNPSVFQTLLW